MQAHGEGDDNGYEGREREMAKKQDLRLKCPECGAVVKVHDYASRWTEGLCLCHRQACEDSYFGKQGPVTLTLCDMMTGEIIGQRVYNVV